MINAVTTSRQRLLDSRPTWLQLLGAAWFFMLACFVGWEAVQNPDLLRWPQLLSRSSLCTFYLLLSYLIASRPPAKARAAGLLPNLAAFVGTYMPWLISFTAQSLHATPGLLSAVFIVGGSIMMIISVWHLGKSFSLVPQAHAAASTGPYRWIRHPLYLSEEFAVFGALLQFPSWSGGIIVMVHIVIQIVRIHYEETLLMHSLPEYSLYAAARWRLIPYVW